MLFWRRRGEKGRDGHDSASEIGPRRKKGCFHEDDAFFFLNMTFSQPDLFLDHS